MSPMTNGDATTGTTELADPTVKPQSQNLGPGFQSVPVPPDPHLTRTHSLNFLALNPDKRSKQKK